MWVRKGNAAKIKETSMAGVTSSSAKSITRLKETEETKRLLSLWTEHQRMSNLSHREKASVST